MSVGPQSRYLAVSGGFVSRVINSAGVYNLTTLRTVPGSAGAFSLYTWQMGDRPDLVAYRFLGNGLLFWAIFDINPEIIDPFGVLPGTVIRIPKGPIQAQGTLTQ